MDVTKPYKFIGFGAMDVPSPNLNLHESGARAQAPTKLMGVLTTWSQGSG